MFFSCTVSWWPGEKTGAENKQISQYLRRRRNPAAFQALGISRAIPTGDTHHGDTLLSLSWSQNFLQPYFSRSALKYRTCRSPNTPRAALLRLSPVISYLLPTAAFTSGARQGQLIRAGGQAAPKAFTNPKKRFCTHHGTPGAPLGHQDPGHATHAPPSSTEIGFGLFFSWLFIM